MNKQLGDLIRTALKVGGAALATSGLLPGTVCHVTDPTIANAVGILSVLIGVVWGQVSAVHHQELVKEVGNV